MTAPRPLGPARSTAVEPRPRNAGASRQALLDAAQQLFGQNGFERTTIRDIGERAGVDHALIVRYFGSKADLYIAALVAEARGHQPGSEWEGLDDTVEGMVSRMDEHGVGPVMQALIRSDTSAQIRNAAQAHMAQRIVAPVAAELTRRGLDEAEGRAEIVAAALIGISLGRALGWFDHLQALPRERLVELAIELLGQD